MQQTRVVAELELDWASRKEEELFKWFLACLLFGKPIQQEIAERAYLEFIRAGLVSPDAIIRAGWDELVRLLDQAHYVRYDSSTATKLLDVARELKQRYGTMTELLNQARTPKELSCRLQEFRTPVDGDYPARNFQYAMAELWIREYHIDGFRIDEFKGINNWDFIQEFREHAWAEHNRLFPTRPFTVIAEDSWRRPEITDSYIYNNKPLVDAAWNFDFRDELRRLLNHTMNTVWGQPSRSDRIRNMISSQQVWNDWDHRYRDHGFTDLAQAVNYPTSHDVADWSGQRLINFFFGNLLQYRGLAGYPSVDDKEVTKKGIRVVKHLLEDITAQSPDIQATHTDALERAGSAFALTLTSVGIPMFLAGEEFGDVHDVDYQIPDRKMSDPVDWTRRNIFGHLSLQDRVRELVPLRTTHPALQRNEVEFFYFHPMIDGDDGVKVFAYCRTGGQPLGSQNQVIVLANCGPQNFSVFDFPNFPATWGDGGGLKEHGTPTGAVSPQITSHGGRTLSVSLAPFQVRVFST